MNSDPMAANAKNMSKHDEAATEHTGLAKKASKREAKKEDKDDETSENLRPMPKLDLKGNEVAHIGHSAFDPSLLVGILPKNKNHLEFEQGTALGSVPGSSSSMSSDGEYNKTTKFAEIAPSDAGGHKAAKKSPKAKNAENTPDRSGSRLRTKPPCVTMLSSKEHVKRGGSDLKQKVKAKDISKEQAANKKATKCKSSESETRLKVPTRKKSNERTTSPKNNKDHIGPRNRSLRKVATAAKRTGSGKNKVKPKTCDNKN